MSAASQAICASVLSRTYGRFSLHANRLKLSVITGGQTTHLDVRGSPIASGPVDVRTVARRVIDSRVSLSSPVAKPRDSTDVSSGNCRTPASSCPPFGAVPSARQANYHSNWQLTTIETRPEACDSMDRSESVRVSLKSRKSKNL